MSLSVSLVNQIFGKYEQQARMAELNRKSPVKTIQNQVDRVTISPEALKKRAIDVALAAIPTSSRASTEIKPASGDNVESTSYADKIVQNALNKSRELKKDDAEATSYADKVVQNALNKSRDLKKKESEEKEKDAAEEAAMKKQKELDEATPF